MFECCCYGYDYVHHKLEKSWKIYMLCDIIHGICGLACEWICLLEMNRNYAGWKMEVLERIC